LTAFNFPLCDNISLSVWKKSPHAYFEYKDETVVSKETVVLHWWTSEKQLGIKEVDKGKNTTLTR